jgi:hypothetical protein
MVKFNQIQGEWLLDFVAVGQSWCLIHQLDQVKGLRVSGHHLRVASWHLRRVVEANMPQDGLQRS